MGLPNALPATVVVILVVASTMSSLNAFEVYDRIGSEISRMFPDLTQMSGLSVSSVRVFFSERWSSMWSSEEEVPLAFEAVLLCAVLLGTVASLLMTVVSHMLPKILAFRTGAPRSRPVVARFPVYQSGFRRLRGRSGHRPRVLHSFAPCLRYRRFCPFKIRSQFSSKNRLPMYESR